MNKLFIIQRLTYFFLLCIIILTVGFQSVANAARKDCNAETDTGNRIKCKMENLNDSFDEFVITVENDDTGTFSGKQKKQLQDLRDQAKNEAERTPPEDFKQLGKKKKVECYIQEILGDVDPKNDENDNGECDGNEDCIGDEDGICDQNELSKGGCAEVLNDGIGDDDGICEVKGHYDETCIEICDMDLIMAVGNEVNVDRGKADDMEQSLKDATDVIDDANISVSAFLDNKRIIAQSNANCDKNTMTACEYLQCLMSNERKYTANEIEGVVGGAIGAKLFADACRDAAKWDVFSNYSALCAIPGLVASGLQIAATTLEVKDDSQSAERLDAIGLCVHESGDQIQEIKASLQDVIDFLLLPPGKREGFPLDKGAALPAISFSTEVNSATVSLNISDLDPTDTDVDTVIVFWGDRNRTEYSGSLPATIEHTYTRTGTNYHIRVKTVNTGREEFNYTFMNDEYLTITTP